MLEGMVNIWNYLTGGKVVATKEYIEYFFTIMDINK
mgnify:CR=1 FL=1